MKESDLFNGCAKFLIEQGCTDIHGEVLNADVIGIDNNIIHIIETKTTLSMKVLEQALERKSYANYVYVCVPYKKDLRRHSLPKPILLFFDYHGIGLIRVKDQFSQIVIKPKFNRFNNYRKNLLRSLNERTRNQIGGVTSDLVFSTYKLMMEEVIRYLKRCEEPKTIKEIVENCRHVRSHYCNPAASLYQTLNASYNQDKIIRIDNKYTIKEVKDESKGTI